MNEEKLKLLSKNLITDANDYMHSFRSNLDMYISQKDITIREIADEADLSLNTLTSLIYGNAKDCKLSTAIALAKALHISLDELVGCNTISPFFKECLQLVRDFPVNSIYFIQWQIKHQASILYNNSERRMINIMHPLCQDHSLKPSNDFSQLDINHLDSDLRSKIFIGIQLTCDRYMPIYSPYDILLVANDRNPHLSENCIIVVCGNLYIAKRKEETENGVTTIKYYSIRDGKPRVYEDEVDELIGYIAAVYPQPQPNQNVI